MRMPSGASMPVIDQETGIATVQGRTRLLIQLSGRPTRRGFLAGAAGLGGMTAALGLLGGCGLSVPMSTRSRVRRVGFMSGAYVEEEEQALQAGLREYGWIEGENLVIERRFYGGRAESAAGLMEDMLSQQVDVLMTFGSTATVAAKAATSTIPIVMIGVGDPVSIGLVSSLAHPEANLTGNTYAPPDLGSKQLQLLMDVAPISSRTAFLWNPGVPGHVPNAAQHHVAARALGMDLVDVLVRAPEDIAPAFDTIRSIGVGALRLLSDVVFNQHKPEWLGFAASQRLPGMYQQLEWIPAGGLMAYLADNLDLARRAGAYVNRILLGAKPSELPIEDPTRYELYVNHTTARTLGLTIPPHVEVQVTRWFE